MLKGWDRRSNGGNTIRYTHVCRYWRAVITSTPILWTTFLIGFPLEEDEAESVRRGNYVAFLAKEYARVSHQVERTKDVPFSALFHSLIDNVAVHPAADLLVQHHHQWRQAFLGVTALQSLVRHYENRSEREQELWKFTNLRTLAVTLSDNVSDEAQTTVFVLQDADPFLHATRLKYLVLCCVSGGLKYSWPQLTSLLLDNLTLSLIYIKEALVQCMSPETLHLGGLTIADEDSATITPPITLPRLHSVFRTYSGRAQAEPGEDTDDGVLLAALHVPSLTQLMLSGPSSTYEGAGICLAQSSTTELVKIMFVDVSFPDRADGGASFTLNILQAAPKLQALFITFAEDNDGNEYDPDAGEADLVIHMRLLLERF